MSIVSSGYTPRERRRHRAGERRLAADLVRSVEVREHPLDVRVDPFCVPEQGDRGQQDGAAAASEERRRDTFDELQRFLDVVPARRDEPFADAEVPEGEEHRGRSGQALVVAVSAGVLVGDPVGLDVVDHGQHLVRDVVEPRPGPDQCARPSTRRARPHLAAASMVMHPAINR
ncbi:hypothetical protein Q9Q99_13900 [Curtobacterium flaccumfaciens]|nr:hypothetical protein Q9Q99_13900 [Curtobacterium flaccumfaciens]